MKVEKRLLGQNCTPRVNNLPALVKHLGLMVLVYHCHVMSSAGCFITEMVRRLGTIIYALLNYQKLVTRKRDECLLLAHIV